MGMHKIMCTVLASIAFIMFIILLLILPAKASTLNVPGDYATIQQAIDNASNGDTILVSAGIYYERISIENKTISLIGEDMEKTIIDGSQEYHTVSISYANGTVIKGFTIRNAGGTGNKCIILKDTSNATISNNIIKNSQDSDGLSVVRCHYLTITNNIIQDNPKGNGILVAYSTHLNIQGNTLQNNQQGIFLQYFSTENTISDNTIEGNSLYGIRIFAASDNNKIFRNHFSNNGEGNAYDTCTNYWYNAETQEGNYWDDYEGVDSNNDGIGDTPYSIPGGDNKDIYVLGDFEGSNPPPSNSPQNKPPVANAGGPYSGYVNQLIYFDASASHDPDGSIVSYKWNFGDGSTGDGERVSHKYLKPGKYTVTLTVKDNNDATAFDSTYVNILANSKNKPPVADAGGPYYAKVGEAINFNASNSYDPDGKIVSYLWNFGDGEKAFGKTAFHSYTNEGTYDVTLIVTDDNGTTSKTSTTAIISSSTSNEITVDLGSSYSGYVGEKIQFFAAVNGNKDNLLYIWNFGDGTENTTQNSTVYHAYNSPGIYNVSVTVIDRYGRNVTDRTTAIITNPWEKESPTPGFEFVFLIISIIVSIALWRRSK